MRKTKYIIKTTTQFKKDYKLAMKRGLKISLLEEVIAAIATGAGAVCVLQRYSTIPVEAIVKVINVNYEKGTELLRRCRTLEEYSRFIHMIREKAKELELQQAVEKSIDECMKEGMLKDFLKKNGGEIMGILCHELTREQCEAIRENDGYMRGLEEGEARGEARGRAEAKKKIEDIIRNFKSAGIPTEIIAQNTGLTEEEIEKL